jgi:acyl-CoA thioester hydrolase
LSEWIRKRSFDLKKIVFEPQVHPFHIDFMRHVSNIVYIEWMEVGRCALLEAVGLPVVAIAEQGFGPVLVDTVITYKRALVLGDTVRAEVWLSELSHASAWMEFRFHNGAGAMMATGRQRGLFVEIATGRPKRIDPNLRQRFEEYLIVEPSNSVE